MSHREGHAGGGAVAPARPAEGPTPVPDPGRNPSTSVPLDGNSNGSPASRPLHPNLNGSSSPTPVPSESITPRSDAVRSILDQAYANRLAPIGVCEPVFSSDSAL